MKRCALLVFICFLPVFSSAQDNKNILVYGEYTLEAIYEITLYPEGKFSYYLEFGALRDSVTGNWKKTNDTLILHCTYVHTDIPIPDIERKADTSYFEKWIIKGDTISRGYQALTLLPSENSGQTETLRIKYIRYLTDTTITTLEYAPYLNFDSLKIISANSALQIAIEKDDLFYSDLFEFELVYYQGTNEYEWQLSAEQVLPVKYHWRRSRNFIIKTRYIFIDGKGKITWYRKERRTAYSVRL